MSKGEILNMDMQTKNKLLEKIISFSEKTFSNTNTAKKYLEKYGITDAGLYTRHTIGFFDGSLLNALPKQGKIIDDLIELGVLKNNKEYFLNNIILPITDTENNIQNIVGININTGVEKYLFKSSEQLFSLSIINSCHEIFHVEKIIDLLSAEMAGINNIIAGRGIIKNNQIKVRKINKNINEILITEGVKAVERALIESEQNDSDGGGSDRGCCATGTENQGVTYIQNGFEVSFGLRKYEIIDLQKDKRKLKATIRISKGGKIHVDTVNFYSSRERKQLTQDICSTFEELPQTIENELVKLLQLCESHTPKEDKSLLETPKIEITSIQEEEARAFGKSKNLIKEILKDYERIGFVGRSENSNKLLCYLSATSRLMGKNNVLSCIILSSSGAGKSTLQDKTLEFFPSESIIKLTSLSGKALFYKERDSLKHKILALEENQATNKTADYAIRMLLSTNQLVSEVTVKDSDGRMTTQTNTIDAGETSVFFTSTNPNMDMETASRFFLLTIDESEQQTREILEHQMNQFSLEGLTADTEVESIKNKHRNFQRLLNNYKVVNPFKIKFNDTRLQSRRLFKQILCLMNAVAFLRQMGKEVKQHDEIEYIEVERKDIETALELAKDILSKSLNELSGPSHNLLKKIDGYLEEQKKKHKESISKAEIFFTKKDLRMNIKWSNARLKNYLNELISFEMVAAVNKKNSLQHYRLLYDSNGQLAWLNNIESMIEVGH